MEPENPGGAVRKLYTAELDVPPSASTPSSFVNWYAFRHAPDIYQIGFDVFTSYRSVLGDMMILDLYEIESVDVFDTPQYRSISQADPYSAEILSCCTNKAHSVYSQVHVAPPPMGARCSNPTGSVWTDSTTLTRIANL